MEPNQPNQPQYQQTVIIVGKQKSVGVAFILAFFFGPLGLLYASVTGGIVMFFVGIIVAIITLGFGLILVWIGCIIWAVVAANNANSKVASGAGASMNFSTAPAQQQPNNPIAQQIVNQTEPLPPIVQSPPQDSQSPPQYVEQKQPENNFERAGDLSLNSFSDWVTNNKKGLMFGLGGIVVVLILVVAVKYVVNLDFSKSKSVSVAGKADSTKMDVAIEGDTNAPTQFVPFGIYPQSSERILTSNDLSILNKENLKIMRNEIFARHGYIFKTPEMKSYFNAQSWYKPLYNDVTSQLTNIEKTNVELIKSYEK